MSSGHDRPPRTTGKLFTTSQHELVIDRNHIIISKIQTALTETLIQIDQTQTSLGNFIIQIEREEKTDFKNDPSMAVFDAAKLKFPLRWRKWKAGDYFYPLGMNHKKKLSDFLIDQKISLADKETTTVLESENEIVWVVGQRIDERYRVIDSTESTVICRLSTVD